MIDTTVKALDDEHWRPLAEQTRAALAHLGYDIGPNCLPGEPDYCGGSNAGHAVAHLAALTAAVNHQLAHLTVAYGIAQVADWGGAAYTLTSGELAADCGTLSLAELGERICDLIKDSAQPKE
jgi:hypothetical protein